MPFGGWIQGATPLGKALADELSVEDCWIMVEGGAKVVRVSVVTGAIDCVGAFDDTGGVIIALVSEVELTGGAAVVEGSGALVGADWLALKVSEVEMVGSLDGSEELGTAVGSEEGPVFAEVCPVPVKIELVTFDSVGRVDTPLV